MMDASPYLVAAWVRGVPDEYQRAWGKVPIAEHGASPGSCAGHAHCSGVTRPGYLEHPVYRFHLYSGEQPPGYWVLDGGLFHESSAWHADPAHVEQEPPQQRMEQG